MHAHESLGGVPKHNMPQRHRTWQTEADVGVRRMIVEKMWVWILALAMLLQVIPQSLCRVICISSVTMSGKEVLRS